MKKVSSWIVIIAVGSLTMQSSLYAGEFQSNWWWYGGAAVAGVVSLGAGLMGKIFDHGSDAALENAMRNRKQDLVFVQDAASFKRKSKDLYLLSALSGLTAVGLVAAPHFISKKS